MPMSDRPRAHSAIERELGAGARWFDLRQHSCYQSAHASIHTVADSNCGTIVSVNRPHLCASAGVSVTAAAPHSLRGRCGVESSVTRPPDTAVHVDVNRSRHDQSAGRHLVVDRCSYPCPCSGFRIHMRLGRFLEFTSQVHLASRRIGVHMRRTQLLLLRRLVVPVVTADPSSIDPVSPPSHAARPRAGQPKRARGQKRWTSKWRRRDGASRTRRVSSRHCSKAYDCVHRPG
jgi:hypothetical protein